MTNQDYITVTQDYQWCVGNEDTTIYHGHKIIDEEHYLACPFDDIYNYIKQNFSVELKEYHCMQSSSPQINDEEAPAPDMYGSYGYVRLVYKDQKDETKTTNWVLFKKYNNSQECVETLFFDCSWAISGNNDNLLLVDLLGRPVEKDKENPEIE